jgi:hypothetical protein
MRGGPSDPPQTAALYLAHGVLSKLRGHLKKSGCPEKSIVQCGRVGEFNVAN